MSPLNASMTGEVRWSVRGDAVPGAPCYTPAKMGRYTEYDELAWFYQMYWAEDFLERYQQPLRDLFVSRLRKGSHVLDLCCGTGRICAWLLEQGFRVTGLDGSREMLRVAEGAAPKARFLCRDVRQFRIVDMFEGVLCTYNSLNHMMSLAELGAVFNNVYLALKPGGRFVFDLNSHDGYEERWNGSVGFIGDDHTLAAEISYDQKTHEATAHFAAYRLQKTWVRKDIVLKQKAYSHADIERRLSGSLFKNVRSFDARRDFKAAESGRLFFVAEK